MMAALDRAADAGRNVEATPPKPAASAPAPTPAKPTAPEAPVVAKKKEAEIATKPGETEPDWSKAPQKWGSLYYKKEKEFRAKEQALESKIKSLETKPFEQAGDAKKLEALEKQLDELRGESTRYKSELVKRDYTQSDEYKRDFMDRADAIYTEGVQFATRLQVIEGETTRQATQADFDRIRTSPPDQRDEMAEDMFGRKGNAVVRYVERLEDLRRDAKVALDRHAADYDRSQTERDAMSKKEQQEYDAHYEDALEGIKEHPEFGKFFREDENDPEATEILRSGFSEMQEVLAKAQSLPPEERAAFAAVYRSQAAAFPRAILEITRLEGKLAAVEAELVKYRGTDPGQGGSGGPTPPAGEVHGIQGAAAVFDQMLRA